MTIDQMRAVLGLEEDVSDADVVQAYAAFLLTQTAPAEPVSIEEAKAQLGMTDDDADDPRISGLIIAAREYAEAYTGLVLTPRPIVQRLDGFPLWIQLFRRPVRAITAITYFDQSGESRTLDPALYRVALDREPVRILPATGTRWPETECVPDAIQIAYDGGFASPEDVPQAIKAAMLMMIRHWYDNSAAVIAGGSAAAVEMPLGVASLLDTQRLRTF